MSLPKFVVQQAHHGVLTRAGLVAHGITDARIRRWVDAGLLMRVGRGGYVLAHNGANEQMDRWALDLQRYLTQARAVLATLPGAYFVGVTAALMWNVPVLAQPRHVRISSDARLRSRRPHVSPSPAWGSRPVDVDGVAVQKAAECVVQVAADDGPIAGLVVADAMMHRRLIGAKDLATALDAYGSRRGVGAARLVIAESDGRLESPAETQLAYILRRAGIGFQPQVTIHNEHGTFVARVDFLLESAPVVVEMDGLTKYSCEDDVRREKARELKLQRLGYAVVRVAYRDLSSPQLLVGRLRLALERT